MQHFSVSSIFALITSTKMVTKTENYSSINCANSIDYMYTWLDYLSDIGEYASPPMDVTFDLCYHLTTFKSCAIHDTRLRLS